MLTIWSTLILAGIYFFVPETYHLVLLHNRAIAIRKSTGDPRYQAGIGKMSRSIAHTILWSCTRPFQLLILEPMLLLLCIFTAFLLGIVSLSRAITLGFSNVYHFPCNRLAGLHWIITGMALGTSAGPLWRHNCIRLVQHTRAPPSLDSASPPAIAGSILVPSATHIH